MGYTDSKLIGSDEGIKLGYIDSKLIRTIVENVDGITLRIDFGTELGSLYLSFDSYNFGNFRDYCFEIQWDLLMEKCLNLIKSSN